MALPCRRRPQASSVAAGCGSSLTWPHLPARCPPGLQARIGEGETLSEEKGYGGMPPPQPHAILRSLSPFPPTPHRFPLRLTLSSFPRSRAQLLGGGSCTKGYPLIDQFWFDVEPSYIEAHRKKGVQHDRCEFGANRRHRCHRAPRTALAEAEPRGSLSVPIRPQPATGTTTAGWLRLAIGMLDGRGYGLDIKQRDGQTFASMNAMPKELAQEFRVVWCVTQRPATLPSRCSPPCCHGSTVSPSDAALAGSTLGAARRS